MNMYKLALSIPFTLLMGCSNAPSEPEAAPTAPTAATPPHDSIVVANRLATPYEFPLHGPATTVREGLTNVYRGQFETVLQHTNTGGIVAWSDFASPQAKIGWPASVDHHDAMARVYLARVGIPENELGQMDHYWGTSNGAPIARPTEVVTESLGYTTGFQRVVGGFRVADSHASVRLNASGVPVSLSIAWPKVPESAIAAARAMSGRLDSAWRPHAALLHGDAFARTEIVIRHSRMGEADLTWAPAIRTHLTGPGGKPRHVDTDELGHELTVFQKESRGSDLK